MESVPDICNFNNSRKVIYQTYLGPMETASWIATNWTCQFNILSRMNDDPLLTSGR